ncbi:MAG TPA: hypothetical protein VGS02_07235 [Acidobacteriaceae bacterium]|nr:hypothetical protein [Acidobacteriaceae bacterium]
MKDPEDSRWEQLKGGYKMKYDPRPAIAKLESGQEVDGAWKELWNELHHQGDVGEASYAAVPELVRIHKQLGSVHWNIYALTAVIDLARANPSNPKLPDWLAASYFDAIRELAVSGAAEIFGTEDPDTARAILAVIAIERNLRKHAEILVEYSEPELEQFEITWKS